MRLALLPSILFQCFPILAKLVSDYKVAEGKSLELARRAIYRDRYASESGFSQSKILCSMVPLRVAIHVGRMSIPFGEDSVEEAMTLCFNLTPAIFHRKFIKKQYH